MRLTDQITHELVVLLVVFVLGLRKLRELGKIGLRKLRRLKQLDTLAAKLEVVISQERHDLSEVRGVYACHADVYPVPSIDGVSLEIVSHLKEPVFDGHISVSALENRHFALGCYTVLRRYGGS